MRNAIIVIIIVLAVAGLYLSTQRGLPFSIFGQGQEASTIPSNAVVVNDRHSVGDVKGTGAVNLGSVTALCRYDLCLFQGGQDSSTGCNYGGFIDGIGVLSNGQVFSASDSGYRCTTIYETDYRVPASSGSSTVPQTPACRVNPGQGCTVDSSCKITCQQSATDYTWLIVLFFVGVIGGGGYLAYRRLR